MQLNIIIIANLKVFKRTNMVFVNHRRTEGEATNLAKRHQEALHGAVRVGEVVRVARGAVVEAAHRAERRPRRQLRARRSLQLSLRAALGHAHAQQLRLVPPRHTAHGRAVLARHQVLRVCLVNRYEVVTFFLQGLLCWYAKMELFLRADFSIND